MTDVNTSDGNSATRRQRARRLLLVIPIVILVMGLGVDMCSGLPLSQGARSPQAWLAGILALGALAILGDGVGEFIGSRDKVTDPLWRRALHLVALLAFAGVLAACRYAARRRHCPVRMQRPWCRPTSG